MILINKIKIPVYFFFVFLGVLFSLVSQESVADNSFESQRSRYQEGGWQSSFGLGTLIKPQYLGSDRYRILPVISLGFRYEDFLYLEFYRGLGVHFFQNENLKLTAGLGWSQGRRESGSSDLKGLGSIGPSLEGQFKMSYDIARQYFVEFDFSHDLSDEYDGYTFTSRLGQKFRFPQWDLTAKLGAQLTFADDNYMDSFFGIDTTQAANSQYLFYNPDGGLRDIGAFCNIRQRLNKSWFLQNRFSYQHLTAEASDSPIVKSDDQMTWILLALYSF